MEVNAANRREAKHFSMSLVNHIGVVKIKVIFRNKNYCYLPLSLAFNKSF